MVESMVTATLLCTSLALITTQQLKFSHTSVKPSLSMISLAGFVQTEGVRMSGWPISCSHTLNEVQGEVISSRGEAFIILG